MGLSFSKHFDDDDGSFYGSEQYSRHGQHTGHNPSTDNQRNRQWSDDSSDALKNVLFYRNEIPSKPWPGNKIDEMLMWFGNYKKLEDDHNYIQWLFPLPESSGVNSSAQQLYEHEAVAIRDSVTMSTRVLQAYRMMLDFYGMRLACVNTGIVERNPDNWMERYAHLNKSTHNYRRITRIITSLGELGYERFQAPWVMFLMEEAVIRRELPSLNGGCMQHWIAGIKDYDERKHMYKVYRELLKSPESVLRETRLLADEMTAVGCINVISEELIEKTISENIDKYVIDEIAARLDDSVAVVEDVSSEIIPISSVEKVVPVTYWQKTESDFNDAEEVFPGNISERYDKIEDKEVTLNDTITKKQSIEMGYSSSDKDLDISERCLTGTTDLSKQRFQTEDKCAIDYKTDEAGLRGFESKLETGTIQAPTEISDFNISSQYLNREEIEITDKTKQYEEKTRIYAHAGNEYPVCHYEDNEETHGNCLQEDNINSQELFSLNKQQDHNFNDDLIRFDDSDTCDSGDQNGLGFDKENRSTVGETNKTSSDMKADEESHCFKFALNDVRVCSLDSHETPGDKMETDRNVPYCSRYDITHVSEGKNPFENLTQDKTGCEGTVDEHAASLGKCGDSGLVETEGSALQNDKREFTSDADKISVNTGSINDLMSFEPFSLILDSSMLGGNEKHDSLPQTTECVSKKDEDKIKTGELAGTCGNASYKFTDRGLGDSLECIQYNFVVCSKTDFVSVVVDQGGKQPSELSSNGSLEFQGNESEKTEVIDSKNTSGNVSSQYFTERDKLEGPERAYSANADKSRQSLSIASINTAESFEPISMISECSMLGDHDKIEPLPHTNEWVSKLAGDKSRNDKSENINCKHTNSDSSDSIEVIPDDLDKCDSMSIM